MNLSNFKVQELSIQEQKNVEGGYWPYVVAGIIYLASAYWNRAY